MFDLGKRVLAFVLAAGDGFAGGLAKTVPHCVMVAFLVVCVTLFLILAAVAPSGFRNGDAAVYAQQIEAGSFGKRTVHIGYYALGVLFTRMVPLDPDYALNILNALLGAFSAGIVLLIAYTITGRAVATFVAPIILVTCPVFVKESCGAEVYIPQLCLFLLSVLLVLWNRPIGAGVLFACAFFVTPSTILAAPFLVVLRPKGRFVVLWFVAFGLLSTAVIAPHSRDYFFGGRGLFAALGGGISRADALQKELRELGGFAFFWPFILAGMMTLAAAARQRLFAVSVLCLWFPGFLLGEKFADVPVQLPLYAILAVVAGAGVDRLLHCGRMRRLVATVALAVFILGAGFSGRRSYARFRESCREIEGYRDTVERISEVSKANFVAIGWWTRGILLEHYLFRRAYTGVWINAGCLYGKRGSRLQRKAWDQVRTAIEEGRDIWFLGRLRPDMERLLLENGYGIEIERDVQRATVVKSDVPRVARDLRNPFTVAE